MKKKKTDFNKIDLKIDEIIIVYNFIRIMWSSKDGFGQYDLKQNNKDGTFSGDSECMDTNEDKSFIKKLMELFVEKIKVEG